MHHSKNTPHLTPLTTRVTGGWKIRIIKEKLFRYFTSTLGSNRFIEVIPTLVESYNNSYHPSIKTIPTIANLSNQEDSWQTLYGEINPSPVPKLAVGDRIRLRETRRLFAKGYLPNRTGELFTISKVQRTNPPIYQVRDDNGETIEGTFYARMRKNYKKLLKKIIGLKKCWRQKREGKKKMYLVKWFWVSKRHSTRGFLSKLFKIILTEMALVTPDVSIIDEI